MRADMTEQTSGQSNSSLGELVKRKEEKVVELTRSLIHGSQLEPLSF